ncbi:MAG: T9SS type A sorting domain-containing protein [bacterium]|nr:T9SS type A sorting domain-containing protein [bacterium]
MTRILSVFNLLKRVGFALLFLVTAMHTQAIAQPLDSLWFYSYGGTEEDQAYDIIHLSRGGFLVCGSGIMEDSTSLVPPGLLMKLDESGGLVWWHQYETSTISRIVSVTETHDGGIAMTGWGPLGSVAVISANQFGDTNWTRNLVVTGAQYGKCIVQAPDRSIMVASKGRTVLAKYSPDGDTVWTQSYGGFSFDNMGSLIIVDSTHFAFCGSHSVPESDLVGFLTLIDSAGIEVWTRDFSTNGDLWLWSLDLTSDGGFVVTGYVEESFGNVFLFAARTDSHGDALWTRVFHDHGTAAGTSIHSLADGGIVITGTTSSIGAGGADYYVRKLNADGDSEWFGTFGTSENEHCLSSCKNSEEDFTLAGWRFTNDDNWDFYVGRVGSEMSSPTINSSVTSDVELYQNFPNPFNSSTQIRFTSQRTAQAKIELIDILGRRVMILFDGAVSEGIHTVAVDPAYLSSGTYIYRLSTNHGVISKQMRFVK